MKRSTLEKYNRAAGHYDLMESLVETLFFGRFRRLAVSHAAGKTLEVGVGTGKNLPYYPPELQVTGIDFSPAMIHKAIQKKHQLDAGNITLLELDAERLSFKDNSFDTCISTFVFCTVPNPVRGLAELRRVLKPAGKAIFLEHMKSSSYLINIFLYAMNIFSSRFLGTSMIRQTQKNITAAGFRLLQVHYLLGDVVRLIIAENP